MFQGRKISIVVALLMVVWTTLSLAAPQDEKRIQVATYYRPAERVLTQLSIRIWDLASMSLGVKYDLVPAESKKQALEWLSENKVSLVLGPFKVKDKYPHVRYINSYLQDSIGVVIPEYRKLSFFQTIGAYFEAVFGMTVAFILFVICVFGVIMWFLEHRKNKRMFTENPMRGIGTSIWHCLVTFSTVGYGDIVPKTFLGRFVAGIWILISLFLVSVFVASITSELTLIKSHSNKLMSLSYLYNRKVGLIPSQRGVIDAALRYHVRSIKYDSLESLVAGIASKQVSAGFANSYVMHDYLNKHPSTKVTLTPYRLNMGSFAFALRKEDPIISNLTNVLYILSESGRIKTILTSVLGTQLEPKHS